jgi:hypothetical protein
MIREPPDPGAKEGIFIVVLLKVEIAKDKLGFE